MRERWSEWQRRVRAEQRSARPVAPRDAHSHGARDGREPRRDGTARAEHPAAAPRAADDARPVVQLVDHVLTHAAALGASDVHLESGDAGASVRYRVDGVLRESEALPEGLGSALVSRLKILAGLDVADRLRPQDGRARWSGHGRRLDLRVSTLPASQGEKVVVRLLDPRAAERTLEALGLDEPAARRLADLFDARDGLVLVTGPTGAGKTTTLYAALRRIAARGVNVVTVEDPVEYRVPGLVQVQVNERAGLTFAAALRSILRQDPDVVLVGEIRDRETAETAIRAAATGHLVLSTLHTNDAVGAVGRMADLGIATYQVAAALRGVVAQRLVRRLCERCRVPVPAGWRDARLAGAAPEGETVHAAGGCDACGGAGYRGRVAIVETLVADAALARTLAESRPMAAVGAAARAAGMVPLWEGGVGLVRRGETTVDELLRVLDPPAADNARGGPRTLVGDVDRGRRDRGAAARTPLPALDGDFELLPPTARLP